MQLPLTSGDYRARSVIASAQRCVNLYGEKNAEGAPFPYTYYPRAGLKVLVSGGDYGSRCSYRASNGAFYEVIGPNVYATSSMWERELLGTMGTTSGPVSMSDNGLVILIVDGSPNGYGLDLSTHRFAQVSGQAGAFYGATRADYVDTFFVLDVPFTNEFYCSLSNVSLANLTGTVSSDALAPAFYSLNIAAKTGNPDAIAGVIVMRREVWLIGTETTEIWYDAGSGPFPFAEIPGVFIEHGCVARYSITKQDLSIYWLSQDRQGATIVLKGNQYAATRISTHAIEQQMQGYATVSDAIGFTYQQLGHVFYILTFPTADRTWAYDVAEDMWHEETWTDANGAEHRIRANNCANVYGVQVCGDWETGALYQIDPQTYNDAGVPIVRRRGFPIVQKENVRLSFSRMILDVAVGEIPATAWAAPGGVTADLLDDIGLTIDDNNNDPIVGGYTIGGGSTAYPLPFGPRISLRWSDNRGNGPWSNPRVQPLGATGQFDTSVLYTQLGMGRDRVFEVFWEGDFLVAINGAYLNAEAAET